MTRFADIRQWAQDRNLIEGATVQAQTVKLMEECGELAAGIARGDKEKIVDSIGDAIVVLTIMAAQCGMPVEACIESAWQEIKDRKGRMVDGIFVKDEP
jgi:NTP pyrophosphatase (non-canonical NTP hydrolase)